MAQQNKAATQKAAQREAAEPTKHLTPQGMDAYAAYELINTHARRGLGSKDTSRTYLGSLRKYLAHLQSRGVHPEKARVSDAASYRESLRSAGFRTATVALHLSVARQLHDALAAQAANSDAEIKPNPFARMSAPATRDAPPAPYTPTEIEKMLEHASGRTELIILLGAHAGLRRAEMSALRAMDVDLESRALRVRGKGNHVRHVPVSKRLLSALETHIQKLEASQKESEAKEGANKKSNSSKSTNARKSAQMSKQPLLGIAVDAIADDLSKTCLKAGVRYRGVHSLRRSAAVKLHQQTGSLQAVQRHLGHASVATTSRYTYHDNDQADIENW